MDAYDALPEAVLVLDRDRSVTACNDRAAVLLGVGVDDLGGHLGDVVTLLLEDGTVCRDPVGDRGVGERLAEQLLQVRLADGRTRPVAMAGRWQADDGIVLTFRSAARRAAVEGRRGDLLATVSHELRTPLTTVRGFTRTLLARWEAFSDEQKRTMLATVHEDAGRLSRLLTELLAASRLDAHRVELHVSGFDVVELVHDVVERARHRPEGQGRDLVVTAADDVPDQVVADRDKVEQVVTNLVDNALRHAPDAVVRVEVAGTSRGGAQVTVADDGLGIPPAQHASIFEKFGRARGGHRPGTGLGLYISRGLARAMGGDVELASVPGEGATFTLTLPAGDLPG